MRTIALFLAVVGASLGGAAQSSSDEQAVRKLLEQWNAAYLKLDAKALSRLHTAEFDIVNRLGQWTHKTSNSALESMWSWAFQVIYNHKPGPSHTVEKIRFYTPTVASVLTRGYWAEEISLDDGTKIPPHGEIDTFTVVKRQGKWKVAWIDVHNQMPPFDIKPGQPLETDFPPQPGTEPK